MKQIGNWDRSGGHIGQWAQNAMAAVPALIGSDVTLADGLTVVKAEYITDEKLYQKYVPGDGQLPGRSKIDAVFVFAGTLYGTIHGGDTLMFNAVRHVANTPLWPQFTGNVCTTLAVPCDIP